MLADVSVESCSGIGSSSAGSASAEHVQVASALVAAAVGEALGAPEPSAANPLPLLLGEDSSDAEGSGMEAVVAAAARGSVPPLWRWKMILRRRQSPCMLVPPPRRLRLKVMCQLGL